MMKPEKRMASFTPKLHLSGYALKTVKFFSFVDAECY